MSVTQLLGKSIHLGMVAGREVGSGLLRQFVLLGDGERRVPYVVPDVDVASGRVPGRLSME